MHWAGSQLYSNTRVLATLNITFYMDTRTQRKTAMNAWTLWPSGVARINKLLCLLCGLGNKLATVKCHEGPLHKRHISYKGIGAPSPAAANPIAPMNQHDIRHNFEKKEAVKKIPNRKKQRSSKTRQTPRGLIELKTTQPLPHLV